MNKFSYNNLRWKTKNFNAYSNSDVVRKNIYTNLIMHQLNVSVSSLEYLCLPPSISLFYKITMVQSSFLILEKILKIHSMIHIIIILWILNIFSNARNKDIEGGRRRCSLILLSIYVLHLYPLILSCVFVQYYFSTITH